MTRYLFALVLLTGCYTLPKATRQHGKAVATFPAIGADYCARTYPPRDSVIKGDSIVTLDTLYIGGEIINDTTVLRDTIRITKVVQLPGREVTRTVIRVDTVRLVNTAAVDLCRIQQGQAVAALEKEQARADKYRKRATTWMLVALGLLLAAGVWGYFKLRRK